LTGHEFLDSVHGPENWRKTKAGADKLSWFYIKLLGKVASGFVRARLRS